MNFVHIDCKLHIVAFTSIGTSVHTSDQRGCAAQVQEHFMTQVLCYVYTCREDRIRGSFQEDWLFMNIFRTYAHDYFLAAYVSFFLQSNSFTLRYFNFKRIGLEVYSAVLLYNCTIDKVHCRGTDKSSNENIRWLVVQLFRGSSLLNDTVLHNNDTVTHRHSLCLVMRYINTSCFETFNQLCNFRTHLTTEFSIQVGKRFVHEEDLWIADNRASQGNPLTLTTGKCLRFTIKQVLDIKNSCSFTYTLVDFFFFHFTKFQTKCHVLIHVHMRIQSVRLENHRNVAIFRSNVVNDAVANVQFTFSNFFKTSDHTKSCRFTTTGWSNQYEEFFICNI
ncbi:hypothetical protein D3C77_328330 [compost metagenome]